MKPKVDYTKRVNLLEASAGISLVDCYKNLAQKYEELRDEYNKLLGRHASGHWRGDESPVNQKILEMGKK